MQFKSLIAVTLILVSASTASIAGVRDPDCVRVMQLRVLQ